MIITLFSRLESVLCSDEAKTFLGDVLAPVEIDDGEDSELNVTGISDSNVIALPTARRSQQDTSCVSQDEKQDTDEFLTSGGESDLEKKVRQTDCGTPECVDK